jgi:ABC-type transport system substrate-binding protein
VNTRRQQSTWGVPVFILLLLLGIAASAPSKTAKPGEEMLVLPGKVGVRGGRVVAALRSEPKTLNPLTALDLPSKEVIALLSDLIHINVFTQQTEPALARSWRVSPRFGGLSGFCMLASLKSRARDRVHPRLKVVGSPLPLQKI